MSARFTLAVLALLAVPLSPLAAQPAAKRAITVDDYFTQADLMGLARSPKYVAYSEARWQEATDDRKSDLWVVPLAGGGRPRRLTSERANDRTPQWDRDGRFVYFLGNRKRAGATQPPHDGTTQVWRITPAGGQPEAVTRVTGGVGGFHLDQLGGRLYYLVHVEKIQDDWSGLRQKFKHLHYGHGINRLGQVWELDLENWRTTKRIESGRFIHDFAVAPGGQRIALISAPDATVVSFEGRSRVDVWERASGKVSPLPDAAYRKQAPSPHGWLEGLAWSDGGQMLAFNVIFDAYPAEIIVADFRAKAPAVFRLPRAPGVHVRGYGSPLAWRGREMDLCFLGEEKARVRLCVAHGIAKNATPTFETLTPGDVVVDAFSVDRLGGTSVVMATPTDFPEIYTHDQGKGVTRLTRLNPQAAEWKLPTLSVVSWKGAGGKTVEGILELPTDRKDGERLPLVVVIHGGPTTATYFKRQFWIYGRTLLAARGYAVLCPNYRGSTGYGDAFVTDLIGNENKVEVEDILKGVDALIERGLADPQRLAVSGWSNGGYLTNCLITHTDRFKAAISGAGIVDAVTEFGTNDEPAYSIVFKRGLPWSNPEGYHRASPTYKLDKIRTPTLIHVGGNDVRCPPGQSRMLYRALKEYVRVPTELIVYPGEAHGLMKYRSRRAKLDWDLAWLRRHVTGKKK